MAFLNRVRDNGAVAILAYSIDDVTEAFGGLSKKMKSTN
jgi:hypothetical protein